MHKHGGGDSFAGCDANQDIFKITDNVQTVNRKKRMHAVNDILG